MVRTTDTDSHRSPDSNDLPTGNDPETGAFPVRRISRNGVAAMINSAAGLVSGIVLIPVMLRELGSSTYGLFALSMAIAAYAGLLDFGINATLTKEVAAHRSLGDRDGSGQISRIASTAFFGYLLIGLGGATLLLLLALPGSNVFGLSHGDATLFRQIAAVLALQVGLSLPLSVWNSVLSGLQDYHVIYAVSTVQTIVRLVVVLVLLNAGMGVVGLVVVGFFTACAAWIGNYAFARRRLPGLRIRPSHFDRREVRRLVTFSGSMVLWSLAGFSLHNGDRLVLGFNERLSGIAEYDIGARLSLYSRGIVQGWLDTLLPHASELNARSDHDAMRETFLRGTSSLLAVYGLVTTCLIMDGGRFLRRWIGPHSGAAYAVLALLVAANLFQSQNLVGHVMLVGLGRIKAFTVAMACYPPLLFLLGWFASERYGVRGMAGAILVTVVIVEGVFMRWILREFSVPFREFLRFCQLPVISGIIGGVGLGSLVISTTQSASLPVVVLGSLTTAVGYAVGYLLATSKTHKLPELFGRVRRSVSGR
jgi:O-antigen/teichoic acid export membrane protein